MKKPKIGSHWIHKKTGRRYKVIHRGLWEETLEIGEIRDVLLKPTKFTEPQAALKDAIGDTLVTIIVLAHQLDLDVTECLGIAYEEIKNRKGKMINGTFVKESDL